MKRKMTIDAGKGKILDCGCELGRRHCQEADNLWADVNSIYRRCGYDELYIAARKAYLRHVGTEIEL